MAKHIIWMVVAAIVGLFLYLGYRTFDADRTLSSGEVRREDSRSTESTSSAASIPPTPSTSQPIVDPAPNEPGGSGTVTESQTNGASGQTLPPGDTLSPLPPDGHGFSGSGKYQLYRQGSITYRQNTETGESCVIFAAEGEWAKPLVRQHACTRK